MKKTYSNIDNFYNTKMIDFSVEDRIDYLENIIDQNQNVLSKSGSLLNKLKRLQIVEIVEAAQKEVLALRKNELFLNTNATSEIYIRDKSA